LKPTPKKLANLITRLEEGNVTEGFLIGNGALKGHKDINGTNQPTSDINTLLNDIITEHEGVVAKRQVFRKTPIQSYGGKNWISKKAAEEINTQFFSILLDVGETEFFDKCSHLGTTDKARAKTIWERLKKVTPTYYHAPTERTGSFHAKLSSKLDSSNKEVVIHKGIENRSDEIFPVNYFNHDEFIEFMEIVFKNNTPPNSLYALSSKSNKKWKITWQGYSYEPGIGQTKAYNIESWIKDNWSDYQVQLNLNELEKEGELRAFVDLALGNISKANNTLLTRGTGGEWENYGTTSRTLSTHEITRRNDLRELRWVEAVREAGVGRDVVSDEELFEVSFQTRGVLYRLRDKEKIKSFYSLRENSEVNHGITGNKYKKDDLRKTILDNTKTGPKRYMDVTPLKRKMQGIDIDISRAKAKKNQISSAGSEFSRDYVISEMKIDDLIRQIGELESERDRLKGKDIPALRAEFDKAYGTGPAHVGGSKVYSSMDRYTMRNALLSISEKESPEDNWTKDAKKKVKENIDDKLAPYESLINEFEGLGDTMTERLEGRTKGILVKYRTAFEEAAKIRELSKSETAELAEIKKAETGSPQTPPKNSGITKAELKEAFGNIDDVATEDLAKKWGDEGITKEKIKEIFEKATNDSDKKTPKAEFISHLGNGLDDGTKLTKTDDNELWKEFLGKDPERVANTIHTHWLETKDNEDNTKNLMKGEKTGTGDDEQKLNMTDYGSAEKDGEPNKKGMVKYLWQKAKGSGLSYYKVKEKNDDNGDNKTPKTKNESWFRFGDGNWRPFVTYGVGVLLIIAIVSAIFWKNIADWWNGPAEEDGKGQVEGDEKEEENE